MKRYFLGLAVLLATTGVTAMAADAPPVVPQVASFEKSDKFEMKLTAKSRIIALSPELKPLADLLAGEIETVFGLHLTTLVGNDDTDQTDSIMLEFDPKAKYEQGYVLDPLEAGVKIIGRNYDAIASGTATLLQLMNPGKDGYTIPGFRISDYPKYPFRAALIDLARKYHSPAGVEQVIELCRLYKLRYLHLHLSDDQIFAFRSAGFPNAGKTNSEFARFEPASTDRPAPYTIDELKGLEQFAKDRGVHLIPELDLPGHSGRLIADEPADFALPGNGSTINIASPHTRAAVATLLNDVMDVFQSTPYVHLGADEVGLGGIEESADFKAEVKKDPSIKSAHDLYCRFVRELHDIVTKRGKTPIVWEEGFNPDGPFPLPTDTIVMSWSIGRDPNEIAKRGYRVINASWTPLYIVRDNRKPVAMLFDWNPTLFGREGATATEFIKLADDSKLMGAQICSWEDSESIELQSLRERAAIVSERCWNANDKLDLTALSKRISTAGDLVDRLTSPLTMRLEGGPIHDEDAFSSPIKVTLAARTLDAALHIRYTLDNALPSDKWKDYDRPIAIERTAHLRAGLFDAKNVQHGYLLGHWFRAQLKVRDNLATNKPVTVGPGPDRTDGWFAKLAVDGRADDANAHWAAGDPAPQWLQVDLGELYPIDQLTLITYWDNNRYYQFTVDVSDDNKAWRQVVDASANTTPATSAGYVHHFPKTKSRYVRVNMLKNSANPYVHIVELIVPRAN